MKGGWLKADIPQNLGAEQQEEWLLKTLRGEPGHRVLPVSTPRALRASRHAAHAVLCMLCMLCSGRGPLPAPGWRCRASCCLHRRVGGALPAWTQCSPRA